MLSLNDLTVAYLWARDLRAQSIVGSVPSEISCEGIPSAFSPWMGGSPREPTANGTRTIPWHREILHLPRKRQG